MIRLGRCLRPLVAHRPGSRRGRLLRAAHRSSRPDRNRGRRRRPARSTSSPANYRFDPDPVELAPGETVLLHLINAGLEVHEVVIGDESVQDAWEAAEAATVGAPPGSTPLVSVAPGQAGLRVVLRSGERADVLWTVPAAIAPPLLIVGCHIPDHWAKGMSARVAVLVPGS